MSKTVVLRNCDDVSDFSARINSNEYGEDYLSDIEELVFRYVSLRSIPTWAWSLPNLRSLSICGERIERIPEKPPACAHTLKELYLPFCSLHSLPAWVWSLPALRVLDLSGNHIGTLPAKPPACTEALETLDLSRCNLRSLPAWVWSLPALRVLDLSGNHIGTLPAKPPACTEALVDLLLTHCGLKGIPYWVCSLPALHSLDLSYNRISTLPIVSPFLQEIWFLNLSNNPLNEMPKTLVLDLLDRGICFAESPMMNYIGIEGLDLPGPLYTALLSNDEDKIIAAYERFEDAVILNEARVILLGDGNAGKTHTVERLAAGGLDDGINPSQTEGIFIKDLYLGLSSSGFSSIRADLSETRVRVWDFGGQHIMHSMHRCFLTKRCLYLVVLRERKDFSLTRQAIFWLNSIFSYAKDAEVVIAVNCEEGANVDSPRDLSTKDIEERFPGRICWNRNPVFYCAKGEGDGFTRLQEVLRERICGLESTTLTFPVRWMNVKREIEKLGIRDADNNDSVRYYFSGSEYEKYCADGGESDPDQREALLSWLNDLGICFSYGNLLSGEDCMILDPEWITKAVYAVINNTEKGKCAIRPRHGCLSFADIYAILHSADSDVSYMPEYSKDEIKYVLGVMRKFKLSYARYDGRCEEERYVEEFIPAICPELQEHDEFEPSAGAYPYKFEYKIEYDFMPDGILHKTMVMCIDRINVDQCYRRAFRYNDEALGIAATVKGDSATDTILITLHCKNEAAHTGEVYRYLIGKIGEASKSLNAQAKGCYVKPIIEGITLEHKWLDERKLRNRLAKGGSCITLTTEDYDEVTVEIEGILGRFFNGALPKTIDNDNDDESNKTMEGNPIFIMGSDIGTLIVANDSPESSIAVSNV